MSSRVGFGVLAQEPDRRHDHAAGAIAALHGARIEERLLHRMQLAVLFEALDGGDLAAADGLECRHARTNRCAVHKDRAGAAAPFAASVFRTGQAEIVAENFEQRAIFLGDSNSMGRPLIRMFLTLGMRLLLWLKRSAGVGSGPRHGWLIEPETFRSARSHSFKASTASSGEGVVEPFTAEKPTRSRSA